MKILKAQAHFKVERSSRGTSNIEGGYLDDGKGLNNWDVFTHIQGNIQNNDNGDVADDHYHKFLKDIEIMNSLGVNAYRFSISWARILPKGRFGEVNPSGIRFYNNLIDNLLFKGIEPFVTIHHHDLPQELEDRYGSWLSPLIQEDFVYFAKICFENFGERVKYWTTLNEPNLFAEMAYIRGWYPPAHCSVPFGNCSAGNSDTEPLIALHNMLLSHAKAVKLYRQTFQEKQGGCIGIVSHSFMYEPLRDEESDREAVRRIMAFKVGWMLDPLVYGDYPQEMRQCLGNNLPSFTEEETECIKGSIDFIGVNHYGTLYAKDCLHSACSCTEFPCISGGGRAIQGFTYTTGERNGVPIGKPTGNSRFFVVPKGLEKLIDYIKEKYNNIPMYVTENGYSSPRQKNEKLSYIIHDVKRINYHKNYLTALARSIRKGADVRGYFVWSLMDNLEWIDGFSVRYGLYFVDRQTLERIPKLSASWYKNFLNNVTSFNDNDQLLNTSSPIKKKFVVTGSENYRRVEGGYLDDGKGLNNWDVFSHIPGKVKNNDNGDVADDHYHRFLEDIEIINSLGVNAYRFSISWARILPKGRFGEVNPSGIRFYNNLIDNLLLRGIEPFVTIYHHELPQELEDRYGSCLSPLIQEDFVCFAKICFENFGDRVKYWITINQPNIVAEMGYMRGWFPPGHCSPPFGNCSAGNSNTEPLIALHNMLLSHAKAVNLYRKTFQEKQGGCIGIVAHAHMYEPLRDEAADREAVRRVLASTVAWMFDPLVYGDYPQEMRQYHGNNLPSFTEEETKYIKGSIDFIGINHYGSLYAKDCLNSACSCTQFPCISSGDSAIEGFTYTTGERNGVPIGELTGNSMFFVVPKGMEKLIDYIKERYNNVPMYVTENGYSPPQKNESLLHLLRDVKRINYHKQYLASLARATRKGADVRGYFMWSLMDNFEWYDGFSMRYGLYYVDRQTLERIPKLSAAWYRNFLNNVTSFKYIDQHLNTSSPTKKKVVTGAEKYSRVEML
ncbi:hypothetical protein Dsin_022521 [Dipteronia sinensis]|uniref:Beta-glucosidase n=1 Tax=Dipteronia sinensis TaxID=43782 RepID=A0AAE0E006_9ROSI|nr:hypothetical protein Dsin_022521 [Dipteronia sinensis]